MTGTSTAFGSIFLSAQPFRVRRWWFYLAVVAFLHQLHPLAGLCLWLPYPMLPIVASCCQTKAIKSHGGWGRVRHTVCFCCMFRTGSPNEGTRQRTSPSFQVVSLANPGAFPGCRQQSAKIPSYPQVRLRQFRRMLADA
ncbi:hypothetical protein N658DRAFT_322554 [Parathielavia hyrcaniae]|uniref:Uncharacterized protein n=1 Tax=Parathielavia hyrcaniae TaxID=113614 RepID=A0AAN6T2V1_9PEZI|nr:hypothetical protein N658DRAFT_322554 [Parathielavia hyrcaniae]